MKDLSRLKKLLAILVFLLNNYGQVNAQDANCDFYQDVSLGQTYYIYSKNYPNYYNPSTTCRWQATCPTNTQCKIDCNVELPYTTGCTGDRLLVSKTGDPSLTGADKYCGAGTLDATSTSNRISIGLISTANSPGGRFLCNLVAQPKDPGMPCACGWKKQTRIVGGVETKVNEFPMMIALVDFTLAIVYCGATIIHTRWVLTAAHCLQGQAVGNVGVLYGEHNIKTGAETNSSTLIQSQEFIMHPQYNNGYDFDIGLVYTKVGIIYSDRVGPACLPFSKASNSFTDVVVQALGWGTESFAGPDSDYLQKVDLRIIDQASCVRQLGSVVTERTVCTFNSGKDACQHDSGGPLVWQDPSTGRVYLLGIIMGGYGCATDRPGLNSRVTQYLDWITLNTNGAEFCKN